MPELTVILVRNAESEGDNIAASSKTLDSTDAAVRADFDAYIKDQAGDERGRDEGKPTLSVRVDPELTELGFQQAQEAMTHLVRALAADPKIKRKVAIFCAPLRTCAATALMLSCADVPNVPGDVIQFRLSSFDAAVAPAAIPIVVYNGLCNGDPQIARVAGFRCAVDAGLLHCAAHKFNDARTKCPMMKCFQRMKLKTAARIDEWDEARDETSGQKLHQVTAVQFFRIEKDFDPWSLREMVPKINLLIDYAEPKRYMLTPRQGFTEPKKHYKEWEHDAEPYIKQVVFYARQAGCDTVIVVVPGAAIQSIIGSREAGSAPEPCCVASVVATVGDDSSDSIQWKIHKIANPVTAGDVESILPRFSGTVNSLLNPPEEKDPSKANPPGSSKWAQFPPPEPEVIPSDYPKLPDFAMALETPMPKMTPSAPHHSKNVTKKKKPAKY